MKRIFIFLCLAFLITLAPTKAALTPTKAAFADANLSLARPVDRECYFFSEKDLSTALFAVPYTYCIQVIRNDGEWLYASYAADEGGYKKLYGYCQSDRFEAVPSAPKCEYLNKVVNVTFSANGGQGSFNPPSDLQIEALYYGGYRHGANFYSYVLCRGAFCYIEGANDDYPLNEYEEQTNSSDTGEDKKSENGANTTGLIIFIVILAVSLVAVGALAFSSKKKFD
ncbi:MAG: hypothetical protein ACI4MB_02185 [Candidatus Coproplasma sp.]